MSDFNGTDSPDRERLAARREEIDQEQRDKIIEQFEETKRVFPGSLDDGVDDSQERDGFVDDIPEDALSPGEPNEPLNDWLGETAVNDGGYENVITEGELFKDYYNVDNVNGAVPVIEDSTFAQLVNELKNCDENVVSVLSDGDKQVTMFQMPPVDSEHYEAIAQIANLNGVGTDGRVQQTQLDSNSMLLIDHDNRAAIVSNDARFQFSNPVSGNDQKPKDPEQEHEGQHEEPDSLLDHLQEHLARLTALRTEEIKNPDKGGGGGGMPALFQFGKKNKLDNQIARLNEDISARLQNPSLQEKVKQATESKSIKDQMKGIMPGSDRNMAERPLSKVDLANVAKIAKSSSRQATLMAQVTDKATELRHSMDAMNSDKTGDKDVLKKMSDDIREKIYGAGGLAHLSKTVNLVNDRNGFGQLGKLENAPDLVKKMKESVESVRLHPVADKLSIDGLKLKGIPGLESLNKAIQDIGQQVSRMFEGLSNALSNLGGRKR